ncbi:MAG: hypothetical protein ACRBFS_12895 [Aureispira sp.]
MFTVLRLFSYFLLSTSIPTTTSIVDFLPPVVEHSVSKTVLLLAHHWTSKALMLDLNVDGSFEGRLSSGEELYGLWEVHSNRKTLLLQNDPLDEEEFQQQYTIVEVSFDRLRLKDTAGKTVTLYMAE